MGLIILKDKIIEMFFENEGFLYEIIPYRRNWSQDFVERKGVRGRPMNV
jgi:hypothetical protein